MRGILVGSVAALALASSGGIAAKEKKVPKQVRELLAMSPADHAARVTVSDDSMETVAKLHTQESFQEKRGLLGIVWNDVFLRAFVDKTTGRTSYQVYFTFRGVQSSWPRLASANYEGPEGLKSTDLDRLASDVDCAGSNLYGGCTYMEAVAFEVDEDLLRTIADRHGTGDAVWRIRFKGQSGINIDEGLVPAEVAGLLARVDQYRSSRGLSGDAADSRLDANSPAASAVKLTSQQLTGDFERDEAAASARYADKPLLVRGRVQSVSNRDETAVLSLPSSHEFRALNAELKEGKEAGTAIGEDVALLCERVEVIFSMPVLKGCEVRR